MWVCEESKKNRVSVEDHKRVSMVIYVCVDIERKRREKSRKRRKASSFLVMGERERECVLYRDLRHKTFTYAKHFCELADFYIYTEKKEDAGVQAINIDIRERVRMQF